MVMVWVRVRVGVGACGAARSGAESDGHALLARNAHTCAGGSARRVWRRRTDLFLDAVLRHEAVDGHGAPLADAVGAVLGLEVRLVERAERRGREVTGHFWRRPDVSIKTTLKGLGLGGERCEDPRTNCPPRATTQNSLRVNGAR